jgi:hypothetical protein
MLILGTKVPQSLFWGKKVFKLCEQIQYIKSQLY